MELIIISIIFILWLVYRSPKVKTPKICPECNKKDPDYQVYVISQPSWSKKKPKVSSLECKSCGYKIKK